MGTLTGTAQLKQDIKSDLDSRGTWEDYDRVIREQRMGYRKGPSDQYPDGPNYVEPIIDDVVTGKTDQEIAMYYNSPRMCYVSPMAKMPDQMRLGIEIGFDSYLRYIIKPRAKLELAMDHKNLRGFSIMKQTRIYNNIMKMEVPDFSVVENFDIIVPPLTTTVSEAERICHIIRKTPAKFDKWAAKHIESGLITDLELVDAIRDSMAKRDDGGDVKTESNEIMGVTTSLNSDWVVLWEVYHLADEEDPVLGIRKGQPIVTVMSPDLPERPLIRLPWMEEDGSARRWPFVQARFECRSDLWYDVRGGGHLCLDDQLEASAVRNARDTYLDYFARPLFENETGENTNNVIFSPGSTLPKGIKPAQMPTMPGQFDFIINSNRASCGRRLGVGAVYNFSSNMSESRKTQKTASEIVGDQNRESSLSSTAVDRFNEPVADMFQMIWDDLRRMRLEFPIIIPGRSVTMFDVSNFGSDVVMIPAASARTLNPDVQLSKSVALADWVMKYADRLPVSMMNVVQTVFGYYDTRLTSGWLASEEDQVTIDRKIGELQQNIMMVAQGGKDLMGREGNVEKLLETIVKSLESAGIKVG